MNGGPAYSYQVAREGLEEGGDLMAKFNTSLVVGLTFVATLGGLLFGWDTAVISGAVSSIDA